METPETGEETRNETRLFPLGFSFDPCAHTHPNYNIT